MAELGIGGEGGEPRASRFAHRAFRLPAVIQNEQPRRHTGLLERFEPFAHLVVRHFLIEGIPGAPAEAIDERGSDLSRRSLIPKRSCHRGRRTPQKRIQSLPLRLQRHEQRRKLSRAASAGAADSPPPRPPQAGCPHPHSANSRPPPAPRPHRPYRNQRHKQDHPPIRSLPQKETASPAESRPRSWPPSGASRTAHTGTPPQIADRPVRRWPRGHWPPEARGKNHRQSAR